MTKAIEAAIAVFCVGYWLGYSDGRSVGRIEGGARVLNSILKARLAE